MKFNIGCGNRNFGEGWTNIDGNYFEHVDSNDIYLKSFNKNSAHLIYASHFIEYFDRNEVVEIIKSWKEIYDYATH